MVLNIAKMESMIKDFKFSEYAKKAVNSDVLSEEVFQKILENTFAVLSGPEELHNDSNISSSTTAKGFYSFLLAVTADFVRNSLSLEEIEEFLSNSCHITVPRVKSFLEYYKNNRIYIELSLSNIGSFLPHITNVRWKMDYIVKSSMMADSEGPLFQISLITEKYDDIDNCKKEKNIKFTCTSQELQDLIYKLKDALRHCSSVISKIN